VRRLQPRTITSERKGDGSAPVCYKYPAVAAVATGDRSIGGYSSVGRASRSHREGQGFESPYLHLASSVTGMIEMNVATPSREVLVDITRQVQQALSGLDPTTTGVASIFIPHTTAGITINEGADPTVIRDVVAALGRLVPREAGYGHSEGNSDAHIKASLVGCHVAIPVENGRLRLGTWQSIYLAEFDGPRTRRVWVVPPIGPAPAPGEA
jgi:secondary thiamine-phosphate synthase enzyme